MAEGIKCCGSDLMADLNKAIGCLNALGLKPKLDSFKDKLVIQKVIYLIQKKGLDLGFSYGIYIRGPYSQGLTKELYANRRKVEELDSNSVLSGEEKKVIEEIKALFDLNKPSVLEIAATFEYFQADARLNEFEALIRLKDLKPFYSETEVAIGVSKAKQLFFKPSETDLSELKKELMPWQNASLRDLSRAL